MDTHIHRIVNRKTFCGQDVLLHRLKCVFPERKSNSNVLYDKKDGIQLGSLLSIDVSIKTPLEHKFYAIATGQILEENNKKYYEVWADLYNFEQARIISTAFRTMNFSEKFEEKKNK